MNVDFQSEEKAFCLTSNNQLESFEMAVYRYESSIECVYVYINILFLYYIV